MNGTADNTHYTTHAWRKKQSQLGMAVNSGVLCTLNASNELSQHGVHECMSAWQTDCHFNATLHYTDLSACVQSMPLLSNKQTQCNIRWCTHQQAEHTHHFHFHFISSILSSWALSSTLLLHTASQPNLHYISNVDQTILLHFSCIQRASQIYISHTSHRVGCTSLNTATYYSTNWRWVKIVLSEE